MCNSYFIWNLEPDLFKIGPLPIRWYGLLFVATFIIAPKLASYIYETEGRPLEEIDKGVVYCMLGTILGARLGHVIFYDLSYFMHHPVEILLPISLTPHFHFTGFRGLASHGAAIGLLISTYLLSKYDISLKMVPPKLNINPYQGFRSSFRWLSDTIVIFIALAGFCIRMGNFMNSEIYGIPTTKPYGVVFAYYIKDSIRNFSPVIDKVKVVSSKKEKKSNYQPIDISITFNNKGAIEERDIRKFVDSNISFLFSKDKLLRDHINYPVGSPLNYDIFKRNNKFIVTIHSLGIPRHPSVLYESLSSLLLFILLCLLWRFRWKKLKEGMICGLFILYTFTLRFFYEFIKLGKNPIPNVPLNTAQLLSIGIIIVGFIYIFTAKKPRKKLSYS